MGNGCIRGGARFLLLTLFFPFLVPSYQTLAFKGSELRDWGQARKTKDGEVPAPDVSELRTAAGRIIKRCNLRGAQLGLTLVFLKYYHGEMLMRLMERQDAMATALTKTVRMFLAVRQRRHLREAKLKEEARRAREEASKF